MASWIRPDYPRRLFLWLLAYSLVLMAGFASFQCYRERQFKVSGMDGRLQLVNAYVMHELARGTAPADIALDAISPFADLRLSVIARDGEVLYDNSLDSVHRTNHFGREEIVAAMAQGSGHAVRRHSESTGLTYFYSATRGADGTVVRTAVPYSLSLDELMRPDYGFLWVMGLIAAVMCFMGYLATRRLGMHIMRLNRFAAGVERGEPVSDAEPFPHDELGDISNHIVRIYARMMQAQADSEREHRAAMREQADKERLKKQLTNNINHELKTPVASIRLCTETLLEHPDMAEADRTALLRRSLANSERLANLLADVAVITRLDDGGRAIEKAPVRLDDIIEAVVIDRRDAAAERGMTIITDIQPGLTMQGNHSLLESVIGNLTDNAIAYSGGSELRIEGGILPDGRITLTVADNGCGVETEHLSRLFERFYRVDKGRSRATGGTGLGLAIVKNAVQFHGGTIKVANRPSGGLRFTITFPN